VIQCTEKAFGVSARRRSSARQNRYVPPPEFYEIPVEEALRLSDRTGTPKQLDLLVSEEMTKSSGVTHFFYSGDISLLRRPCVAIVGTRQVSREGATRTERLARELVREDIVVVSGAAAGVDTCAHSAAIEAGGKTIAIIGTPLDRAYPAENAILQQKIYENHLLISQFQPGTRVGRTNFPQRNKLMATLSDATVVMEASDTSGTLHQAAECKRLGRWLFIARSVVEDRALSWPRTFLKYERCVPLDHVSDIISRVKK